MASRYSAINVYPATRDRLRRFAAVAGGQAGRRLTLGEALDIAIQLATNHIDEIPTEPNGEAR